MGLDFSGAWFLLAIPVGLLWIWLLFLRRGRRSLKGWTAAVLRSVSVVLLALAMAGTSMAWRGNHTQLIVLADRSQSMQGEKAEQEEWIRAIEKALPEHYALSVVSFGEDAQIESSFAGADFGRFQKQVRDGGTDYEQSLRFASGLFAGEAAKQVLLLTDGRDTQGDIGQVTGALNTQGIRVDAHVFEREPTGDAQVTRVDVPGTVYQNEKFDIVVEIDSEVEKQAKLLLYSGSSLMSSQDVSLQKGSNRFVFQDTAEDTGLVDYRAVLQESGGIVQNNQRSTVAKVMGTPRVLLVEGAPGAAGELEKMLLATSIEPETRPVDQLPSTAAGMQKYDVAVLVNVSAEDLSGEQTGSLDHFVRTLGRGLVVFGGDNSYALGSYIGSDLEKILPLESNVRNKLDMPSLALVIAIDHSGSMAESAMGATRLDLAKESAQRAVEQLTPQDQVGVIAFDDTAKWVAELQSAENAGEVSDLIGGIRLGGGTMMYSSINEAYLALQKSDAAIKHVILLTDGQPADRGFEGLIAQMQEEHITVSGVAMGADANASLMKRLSTIGGGRFYHVDAGDNIPAIFAKETQLSTQSYLQNRTFFPEYVMSSPLTSSFQAGLPALDGFLATIAKPTATVALQSDNGLPILAHWQYGAGQAVAWTSDVQGSWSADFMAWEDSAAFFGGFVANTLKPDSGQGYLELTEQGSGGVLELEVEGMDQAKTEAVIIAPDGQEIQAPMHLKRPGLFTAEFPLEQEGVYAVRVEQKQGDQVVNVLEGGLPKGYAPEYDNSRGAERQALTRLLTVSGGEWIDTPEQLFETPLDRAVREYDLTVPFLVLGLLFFFLDVAARRLQWEAKAEALLQKFRTSRRQRSEAAAEARNAAPAAAPASAEQPPREQPVEPLPEKPQRRKPAKPETASADMSAELLARRRKKR